MKPTTKLQITAKVELPNSMPEVTITVPAAVALGIHKDEELPPVGSDEWNQRMRAWEDPATWEIEVRDVEVEWANPAHDPDTIPFPGIEPPAATIRWSA